MGLGPTALRPLPGRRDRGFLSARLHEYRICILLDKPGLKEGVRVFLRVNERSRHDSACLTLLLWGILKEFFKPLLIFLIFTLMLNSSCRKRCFTFTLELSLQFYGISHSNYVDMTCLHCLVSYVLNMIFWRFIFKNLSFVCTREREKGKEIDLCPDHLSPEESPKGLS